MSSPLNKAVSSQTHKPYNGGMPASPVDIKEAAPFLKWAGGKSRLLKQYAPYIPPRDQIRRYYEPFIGSAALFFHLRPPVACLSDVNEALIETYRVVRDDVEGLIAALKVHHNDQDYYYAVRTQNPAELTPAQRAARLIFLNKTCYNGLYRENKKGQFNVPFGRYKNPTICNERRLRDASKLLQSADLRVADFDEALQDASAGDFIYFDPPYVPLTATSNFTSYNRFGFGEDEQKRLAGSFHECAAKNCSVMLSNSDTPLVHQLYGNRGYTIVEITARRSINSNPSRRGVVKELLITNTK